MDKNAIVNELSEIYLMHKDIPVARMELSDGNKLSHISYNEKYKEHIPFGGQLNSVTFLDWWSSRSVPKTRHGAKTALKRLGYASTGDMLVDNLALSLTDCYWIKPINLDITWEDVNLYDNSFIDYFGEITINQDTDIKERSDFSLATSQGDVQKKWIIRDDGTRALIKGNSYTSYQQSINEEFATLIHSYQDKMPYTAYHTLSIDIENNKQGLGCICDLFTGNSVEFVSAWEVICNSKKRSHDSYYSHFRNQCIKNGLSEEFFERFQSYEILTDMLMSNTDRHMNNIGILRNPDTLEWIGFAPIYDTGNSMFYNETDLRYVDINNIKITSFLSIENRLLRYVKFPDIVDLEKLPSKDEFISLYEKDIPERHARIERMWELFQMKVDIVEKNMLGSL